MPAARCKFLVIDDNAIDRLVTATLLKSRGITDIDVVNSGAEGIEWIKNHQETIGQCLVIVLDIMMPEMDGFQFLEAFEALDSSIKKITQVFMLSSTLDPHDIQRAENHHTIKELLSKPLSPSDLVALVDR